MDEKEARKSRIRKSICRTIQTAKFESLVVEVSFDEDVEWTNTQERQRKSENIMKLLLKDFENSMQMAKEQLGLVENVAFVKDNTQPSREEDLKNNGFDAL